MKNKIQHKAQLGHAQHGLSCSEWLGIFSDVSNKRINLGSNKVATIAFFLCAFSYLCMSNNANAIGETCKVTISSEIHLDPSKLVIESLNSGNVRSPNFFGFLWIDSFDLATPLSEKSDKNSSSGFSVSTGIEKMSGYRSSQPTNSTAANELEKIEKGNFWHDILYCLVMFSGMILGALLGIWFYLKFCYDFVEDRVVPYICRFI